jgi:hypothetical protein
MSEQVVIKTVPAGRGFRIAALVMAGLLFVLGAGAFGYVVNRNSDRQAASEEDQAAQTLYFVQLLCRMIDEAKHPGHLQDYRRDLNCAFVLKIPKPVIPLPTIAPSPGSSPPPGLTGPATGPRGGDRGGRSPPPSPRSTAHPRPTGKPHPSPTRTSRPTQTPKPPNPPPDGLVCVIVTAPPPVGAHTLCLPRRASLVLLMLMPRLWAW